MHTLIGHYHLVELAASVGEAARYLWVDPLSGTEQTRGGGTTLMAESVGAEMGGSGTLTRG